MPDNRTPDTRHTVQGNIPTQPGAQKPAPPRKRPGLGKAFAISLVAVLGVVGASGALIYRFGHTFYHNMNYVADEDVQVVEMLPQEATEEEISTEESLGIKVDEEALNSIHSLMQTISEKEVYEQKEEVYNLLLIGVDRRDKSWNGNSDSMILASIDKANNRLLMTSLMRDTYVDIPGIGYKKLNAAYAYGSGPLLCQTITNTFKVPIERYAAVDFFDLIDIIDEIGGVDLDVSEKEADVANGYIVDMCNLMNISSEGHLYSGGGSFHADGLMAVGFARIRYVGNSDFDRTGRQRYVLQQLMKEVSRMSLAQMTTTLQGILKHVTTNIPEAEIWDMIREVPDFLKYNLETSRIPYDDMYTTIYVGGQDMLVPYWEDTITKLQDSIYGAGTADAANAEKTTEKPKAEA